MSFMLNGSQQWTNTPSLTDNSSFTVMTRAYINPAYASNTFDIVSEWYSSNRQFLRIYYSNGRFYATIGYYYIFIVFTQYGTASVTSVDAIQTDRWYHLAVTFANNTLTLYVDGESSGSDSHSYTNLPTNSITIGAARTGNSSYSSFMQGEVKDFRVYGDVLDPNIIKTISTLNEVDVINDGIVGRWSFSGPVGTTVSALTEVSGTVENAITPVTTILYG